MLAQEAAQNLRVPVGGFSLAANCFMPPLAMATILVRGCHGHHGHLLGQALWPGGATVGLWPVNQTQQQLPSVPRSDVSSLLAPL